MAITITQNGGQVTSGKLLKVSFYAWQNGQIAIWSHAILTSAVAGPAFNYGDVAYWYANNFDAAWKPQLNVGVQILGVKIAALAQLPPPASGIARDTDTGANASPTLPGQASYLISLYTNLAGRAYRGRNYVPFPMAVDQDTDNTPKAAVVTALQAVANALYIPQFITTGGGGTMTTTPVIYHRETQDSTPIFSALVQKRYATQRRRGDYGRLNSPEIT